MRFAGEVIGAAVAGEAGEEWQVGAGTPTRRRAGEAGVEIAVGVDAAAAAESASEGTSMTTEQGPDRRRGDEQQEDEATNARERGGVSEATEAVKTRLLILLMKACPCVRSIFISRQKLRRRGSLMHDLEFYSNFIFSARKSSQKAAQIMLKLN